VDANANPDGHALAGGNLHTNADGNREQHTGAYAYEHGHPHIQVLRLRR
jgi:hypothetical protein